MTGSMSLVAFFVVFLGLQTIAESTISQSELDRAYADEIKEFHFHVYFFQDNARSNASAAALFYKIKDLAAAGFFHPVPLRINHEPVGPHVVGSYEVWCPKEHFSRTYSWLLLNRGPHSVLIHPLTRFEVIDHSDHAAFMGAPVPLDLSALPPVAKHVPLQYPELGLGYSAPPENRSAVEPDSQPIGAGSRQSSVAISLLLNSIVIKAIHSLFISL